MTIIIEFFEPTGAVQFFTVPASITLLSIQARGGSGGRTAYNAMPSGWGTVATGAGGGPVDLSGGFFLAVTPGQILALEVGSEGQPPTLDGEGFLPNRGGGGWPDGGDGGAQNVGSGHFLRGGGGGGSTRIWDTVVGGDLILIVAGGGAIGQAGTTSNGFIRVGDGGNPPFIDGQDGHPESAGGGHGATISAGGAVGLGGGAFGGTAGSSMQGGDGADGTTDFSSDWNYSAGGGGGGLYGGGGGGHYSVDTDGFVWPAGAQGGGGSSIADLSVISNLEWGPPLAMTPGDDAFFSGQIIIAYDDNPPVSGGRWYLGS